MCDDKLRRAIRELCTRAGVTLVSLEMGGKHPKGRVQLPDGSCRTAVFAKTTGDVRQNQNQVSMMRRWARETHPTNHKESHPQ